jgi:hypothetical protein
MAEILRTPSRVGTSVAGLFALLTAACGGESTTTPEPAANARSEGGEAPPSGDELAVTGLRGTLSQSQIQGALEPRMLKFSRCVERRSSEIEWLSGKVELTFHIALDGSVARVFPSLSELGDREAERCIVEVAQGTRFPRPSGGEADFSWSLEVPPDPDVREPVAWDAAQASEILLAHAAEVLGQCGGGAFDVTLHVDTSGSVLAGGVTTKNEDDADKLDCVAEALRAWTFPSPGSYPARISFGLR